jgi:hypothetical protein
MPTNPLHLDHCIQPLADRRTGKPVDRFEPKGLANAENRPYIFLSRNGGLLAAVAKSPGFGAD